jgi:hypothetical protein
MEKENTPIEQAPGGDAGRVRTEYYRLIDVIFEKLKKDNRAPEPEEAKALRELAKGIRDLDKVIKLPVQKGGLIVKEPREFDPPPG